MKAPEVQALPKVYSSPHDEPFYYWAMGFVGGGKEAVKGISFTDRALAQVRCFYEGKERARLKQIGTRLVISSAAAPSKAMAIRHAYFEAIERIAKAIAFSGDRVYDPIPFAKVKKARLLPIYLDCLSKDIHIFFYDVSLSDTDCSTYIAKALYRKAGREIISFGSKAHKKSSSALMGSLEEAISNIPWLKTHLKGDVAPHSLGEAKAITMQEGRMKRFLKRKFREETGGEKVSRPVIKRKGQKGQMVDEEGHLILDVETLSSRVHFATISTSAKKVHRLLFDMPF